MKPALLLTSCVLFLGACRSQAPRYPVAPVELAGATLRDNALLGFGPEGVRDLFDDALETSGRFERVGDEAPKKARPWRLSLEVPFTREVLKDGNPHSFAEVGANLSLERFGGNTPQRYEIVGLGEAAVEEDSADGRRTAMRAALESVLRQVTESAVLQLAALDRADEALVADLQATDARVREFALRTLAERKHPAAAPLLIERLKDTSDADQVRRTIGALAEMKAKSAVPALIDLARGKDSGFLQEIVFAVGEIGGPEAEAYLYTVAQGHDTPSVQAAAQQALDTLYASRNHATAEARGQGHADP
ncbi:HEAT repeat domain-containing protein [Corallococcus sp. AB049A]|uniref:HEAT repeat domain-containing protein n=1 Tax=Corallococcus interemptor TaxID=2316720 RepID=A0A3A8PSB4_9BACT|nr:MULTISPECIES: HEAT repeat domain-containing protein [Corallococcus]RKH39006.1 HEAT repeat domain-containing protein [Corallococcus sp. AB050B]RKH58868.1 HEAT repeat domain-containing protein [Corallococcus interemptor]RKI51334.1 HEAT repeat domain-containing protein [Corallococcus sp. AB049A]